MIDSVLFEGNRTALGEDIGIERALKSIRSKKKIWLNLSPGSSEELEKILSEIFPEYYKLVLEDCLEDSKPKIEEYPGAIFCVFKTYPKKANNKYNQISLILTKNALITYHSSDGYLKKVRDHFSKFGSRNLDFVFYKVLDRVISDYCTELEEYDDLIDAMEKKVIEKTSAKNITRLMGLKSDFLRIHRILVAEREILLSITRDENETLIKDHTRIYLRDIYDDVTRLIDREEMYKERISNAVQLHIAMNSNEFNETMKKLTVLASFVMIPMLVTGIYGMNFRHMPELSSPYGYPFAFLLMAIGVAITYAYFKRKSLL